MNINIIGLSVVKTYLKKHIKDRATNKIDQLEGLR